MSKNIVQLNNSFIQNEHQRRRYLMKERQKRNRFMGWVLILMILLFIYQLIILLKAITNYSKDVNSYQTCKLSIKL